MSLMTNFFLDIPFKALDMLYIAGVTFAVIGPRMPFDIPWKTIGGNLSRPLRWIMLVLLFLKPLQKSLSWEHNQFRMDIVSRILFVTRDSLWMFSCFLTAYLLRRFMAENPNRFINIGGTPGGPLQAWLLMLMSVFAFCIFVSEWTDDVHWWGGIRLVHAASTWPVLQALKLYNDNTSSRNVRYPGRGFVIAQTVVCYEWVMMGSMIIVAIGELGQPSSSKPQEEYNYLDKLCLEVRHISLEPMFWTRNLLHAVLVNHLDEMAYVPVEPAEDPDDEEPGIELGRALLY